MPVILVKAINAHHDDPEKDRGCYKRGDPVVVMPDDHVWGNAEQPPMFQHVKVEGDLEKWRAICAPEITLQLPGEVAQEAGETGPTPVVSRRRAFSINLDTVPVKQEPLTESEILAVVLEKTTGKLNPKLEEILVSNAD